MAVNRIQHVYERNVNDAGSTHKTAWPDGRCRRHSQLSANQAENSGVRL